MEAFVNIPQTVLSKARKGNREALSWLYEQYSKAMFNICVRMAGNRIDAEDILQESFVQAFNNLHQLKEDKNFGSWLKKIVVNHCIKQLKQKKIAWLEIEDHHNNQMAEVNETAWWTDIDFNTVHQQIKALPDGCRQIFTLYVLEDYSHKAIAELLGITEGTSKSQYHRARKMLKESLTPLIK